PAACTLFPSRPAGVLMREAGHGGRVDATNVSERPRAAVITPISIDQTEHLGPTLADIAGEKAGSLKPGVPTIVAHQEPAALAVIERAAATLRSKVLVCGERWTAHEERSRLIYTDESSPLDLPRPRLFGRHQ